MALLSGCAGRTVRERNSALYDGMGGSPAEFDQAQSSGPSASIEARKAAPAAIRPDAVQPGYLWEISNPTDKGINGKYRVDFDGKLRLAYGIVVDTNNLSESELKAKVAEAFRPFLKAADRTRVYLGQRKIWVDVRGLVNKPGKFLVDPDESLDAVLAQAGGVTPNSQAEYVQIQQKGGAAAVSLADYYDTGNSTLLPVLQGGTIFFVQRKNEVSAALASASHPIVQVYGEVKTPGELAYRSNADFLYYLTRAGGPTSVADLGKIEVIRWVDGKRKSEVYNWNESHELASLQPQDLVILHSNQPTLVERTLQSAAGLAAILSAIGILVIAF